MMAKYYDCKRGLNTIKIVFICREKKKEKI